MKTTSTKSGTLATRPATPTVIERIKGKTSLYGLKKLAIPLKRVELQYRITKGTNGCGPHNNMIKQTLGSNNETQATPIQMYHSTDYVSDSGTITDDIQATPTQDSHTITNVMLKKELPDEPLIAPSEVLALSRLATTSQSSEPMTPPSKPTEDASTACNSSKSPLDQLTRCFHINTGSRGRDSNNSMNFDQIPLKKLLTEDYTIPSDIASLISRYWLKLRFQK